MYKFKEIQPILSSKDMIDVVLSKTQRKTPTEVHPQFKISRIRSFYMRKVKFAQATFEEKFQAILEQFPKIDDLHPFYADLCNVLYDRDHYKLALGQVKTIMGTVESVSKEYLKLLKFSDSLFKCKMLKRAALGRMCTSVKKLSASLQYLEEVRQHLSRLPQINPSTRTLILTGYPNVGKSSFMNLVTNANVDVQPYAFTTKSVFVGHTDFQYSTWQVLDTPGILDHPLEQRNTIEMTAITALAHIHAAILFFVDVSECCGFSLPQQVSLFHSIKPLFKNKPLIVVLNKTDVRPLDQLTDEERTLIESMKIDGRVTFVPTSCITLEGVDVAKNTACKILMDERVEKKIVSNKVDVIRSRMHVSGNIINADRPAFIPSTLTTMEVEEQNNENEFVTEKELQEAHGGAGVFSTDWRKGWTGLRDETWNYDKLPEIMDGHNILDFVDPEIEQRLIDLEKEEEAMVWADNDDMNEADEWNRSRRVLDQIHKKVGQQRLENRLKTNKSRKAMVRAKSMKSPEEVYDHLQLLGKNGVELESIKSYAKKSKKIESIDDNDDDELLLNRNDLGLSRPVDRANAELKRRSGQKKFRFGGKQGEADRFISVKKPKHLYSGKRSNGTTDWRAAAPEVCVVQTNYGHAPITMPADQEAQSGTISCQNQNNTQPVCQIEGTRNNKQGMRELGRYFYVGLTTRIDFECVLVPDEFPQISNCPIIKTAKYEFEFGLKLGVGSFIQLKCTGGLFSTQVQLPGGFEPITAATCVNESDKEMIRKTAYLVCQSPNATIELKNAFVQLMLAKLRKSGNSSLSPPPPPIFQFMLPPLSIVSIPIPRFTQQQPSAISVPSIVTEPMKEEESEGPSFKNPCVMKSSVIDGFIIHSSMKTDYECEGASELEFDKINPFESSECSVVSQEKKKRMMAEFNLFCVEENVHLKQKSVQDGSTITVNFYTKSHKGSPSFTLKTANEKIKFTVSCKEKDQKGKGGEFRREFDLNVSAANSIGSPPKGILSNVSYLICKEKNNDMIDAYFELLQNALRNNS